MIKINKLPSVYQCHIEFNKSIFYFNFILIKLEYMSYKMGIDFDSNKVSKLDIHTYHNKGYDLKDISDYNMLVDMVFKEKIKAEKNQEIFEYQKRQKQNFTKKDQIENNVTIKKQKDILIEENEILKTIRDSIAKLKNHEVRRKKIIDLKNKINKMLFNTKNEKQKFYLNTKLEECEKEIDKIKKSINVYEKRCIELINDNLDILNYRMIFHSDNSEM